MKAELLALLEEKPYSLRDLVQLLGKSYAGVQDTVRYLEATHVVVCDRRGPQGMIVSLRQPGQAPTKPPAKPGPKPSAAGPELLPRIENVVVESPKPPDNERVKPRRGRPPRASAGSIGANVMLDRQLGIVEPVSGPAVCAAAGCGKRFTPDREDERFCSEACQATGPASSVRTVVVDGVEFIAVSVGSQPVCRWPETDLIRGSSLTGLHEVKQP